MGIEENRLSDDELDAVSGGYIHEFCNYLYY